MGGRCNSEPFNGIFGFVFQVWGVKGGPYEFKPAPASSFGDMYSPLKIPPLSMEKSIEGSFVLEE